MEKLDGETLLEDTSGLIHSHITTRSELYEAEFLNIAQAKEADSGNFSNLIKIHKELIS